MSQREDAMGMARMLGRMVLPMLGLIALTGACQAEPDETSAAERGDMDDVAAEEVALFSPRDDVDPVRSCRNDNQCRDFDSDTVDWCDDGHCEHMDRDECEDFSSSCRYDDDCRDGDYGTKDWCYHHSCHHVDRDSSSCS